MSRHKAGEKFWGSAVREVPPNYIARHAVPVTIMDVQILTGNQLTVDMIRRKVANRG